MYIAPNVYFYRRAFSSSICRRRSSKTSFRFARWFFSPSTCSPTALTSSRSLSRSCPSLARPVPSRSSRSTRSLYSKSCSASFFINAQFGRPSFRGRSRSRLCSAARLAASSLASSSDSSRRSRTFSHSSSWIVLLKSVPWGR